MKQALRESRIRNMISAIELVNFPQELWEALKGVDRLKLSTMRRMIDDILSEENAV